MKKFSLFIISLLSSFIFAQEVQLHYDYLKDREYFTGTFEIFKTDKLGSTFFFTDFNFDRKDGANLAYFEIARKFNIPNKTIKGLNFHVEYNDGLLIANDKQAQIASSIFGVPINRAFLTGFGFPIKLGNLTINTSYLYKNTKGSDGIDGQFTAVVFHNLFKDKLTIRGFLDIWTEDKAFLNTNKSKQIILLTEPQILYNINKTFSVGSEIEISKNFDAFSQDWKVFPTVMIKWSL